MGNFGGFEWNRRIPRTIHPFGAFWPIRTLQFGLLPKARMKMG